MRQRRARHVVLCQRARPVDDDDEALGLAREDCWIVIVASSPYSIRGQGRGDRKDDGSAYARETNAQKYSKGLGF